MPRPYLIHVYVHKANRNGHAMTAFRDDRDGTAVMVSKRQLAALPALDLPSAGIIVLENMDQRRLYVCDSSHVVNTVLACARTHAWWKRAFILTNSRLPRSANINYLAKLVVLRLKAWCQAHGWRIAHAAIDTTHHLPLGEQAAVENLLMDFEGILSVLGLSAFNSEDTDDLDE